LVRLDGSVEVVITRVLLRALKVLALRRSSLVSTLVARAFSLPTGIGSATALRYTTRLGRKTSELRD
jgi:hypothetical protein